MKNNPFFGNIEKKTGVNMNEVLKLANSLQSANFKDEKTVRNVVKQVAQLANKRVPKEMEDKITNMILNNKVPADISSISKMMNDKKK